ncbi:Abi family protein [Corynebacterium pseudopelargi]|nr:Abi family protein [Corynebacterium pseudopelargi]
MESKSRLETMLGAARFETYYLAAGEDLEKAVDLYRWNTRMAGALHSHLSYFEVLMRNAMNLALQDWNETITGSRNWCLEHQSADLLYSMLKRPMMQARRHATKESRRRHRLHPRKNQPLTHDDVVAQLTLGNWSNLLGEALPDLRPKAKVLWADCLHNAFPNIDHDDQSRVDLGKRVERLTRLRNRVSHQENLLGTNFRGRLNDTLSVLKAIDNSYPQWALVESQVRQIAREDPRKQ